MADVRVVVTMRVADLPVPHSPSNEARCADCGSATWLSIATEADALPGDVIVCSICAVLRLAEDEEPTVAIGPETRRAVEAWRRKETRQDG